MRADPSLMKQLNKRLLRSELIACRSATKPELSERTGLSVVTVGSLMEDFLNSGEVTEAGMAPSGGGRPSVLYRYEPGYRYAAVVYGHQHQNRNYIHVLVVDVFGQCVWRKEIYCDEIGTESFDAVLDEAAGLYPQIGLIAFGLPGEAVGDVVTVHDYQALIGPEFIRHCRERRGVPVLYENDINAMAYGAFKRRQGRADEPLAGVYFPRIYPPGAGFILNGRIYYGAGHFAGEIDRLPAPVLWRELNYDETDAVLKNVKSLLSVLCCVTAPSRIALYGDFFTEEMREELQNCVTEFVDGKFPVETETVRNLEEDFELGMKKLALERLLKEMNEEGQRDESERKNAEGIAVQGLAGRSAGGTAGE